MSPAPVQKMLGRRVLVAGPALFMALASSAAPSIQVSTRTLSPAASKRLSDQQKAAAAAPKCANFSACYNRADAAAKKGRCREAFELYGLAIRYKPDDPWAWYHRALLRRAGKDERGAQLDFSKALALKGRSPDFKKTILPQPSEVYGPKFKCQENR